MYNLIQSSTICLKNRLIDLSQPKIMGIVNLTADSFYDGGRYQVQADALQQAGNLLQQGADILDIGAHSSRPGAQLLSPQQELERLLPFIQAVLQRHPAAILSVDTFRAEVAQACIEAGAAMINDVSGGSLDPEMFSTVARLKVPYILMHMRGTPENMQTLTQYQDLVGEMLTYFIQRVTALRALGVKDIILDPGFGFAKTLEQNYHLLQRFDEFSVLGLPLLGALSRKSMIYRALGVGPQEALNGTTVLHTVLLSKGAAILRVHDALEAKQAIELMDQLRKNT